MMYQWGRSVIDAFYADPHFGHEKIIEYEKRPFSNVNEMNDSLITMYNQVVGETDTCIWVGDAFLTSYDKSDEILSHLNGKKILVRGNHDGSISRMLKLGFDIVCENIFVWICGKSVRISHYPYWDSQSDKRQIEELGQDRIEQLKQKYPQRRKGEILIHGHIHGGRRFFQNMINVGVDAWNYRPVRWSEVENEVRKMVGE